MKKTLSTLLALVMALAMIFGCVSFAAAEETAPVEAYIMYANGDWSVSYWNNGEDTAVAATNAEITGDGSYTVALDFTAAAEDGVDTAFNALGVKGAIEAFPKMCLKITAVRINGEPVEFAKGYTNDEDGATRMNIYNEWAAPDANARSWDGDTSDASAIMIQKDVFTGVKTMEVDFDVITVKTDAAIVMANADWSVSYWNDGSETAVTATNAEIKGEGTYTVGLEFPEAFTGIAFAAVKINNGNVVYPGYFIDVKEVKINGEAIELGKGYTSSDDTVEMRSNLYNEWVTELPADARRADGDLEGASAIVVDPAVFTDVKSIEATFDFIYGEAPAVETDEPLTAEEAAELQKVDYNAYIGVQSETYIFRNTWDEANYGRDSQDNPECFGQLTGWDADNNKVNYGGTFEDALLAKDGTYTVSLTTGDMGFGEDTFFRMLFVSTEIPSKLVKEGYVTIDDVQVKIGDASTQKYTDVDTGSDYARIIIIDEYNRGEAPFGYTVPGANATISITFTVSGLTD